MPGASCRFQVCYPKIGERLYCDHCGSLWADPKCHVNLVFCTAHLAATWTKINVMKAALEVPKLGLEVGALLADGVAYAMGVARVVYVCYIVCVLCYMLPFAHR